MDRSQNSYNFDYILINDLEDSGLRYYCHKYIFYHGKHDITFEIPNLIGKGHSIEEEWARRNRQVILKCIVQITGDPCIFISTNKEDIEVNDNNHIFVFENQLTEPKLKTIAHQDYLSWLKEYGIQRDQWLLVDVDNYMKGNSYFKKIESEVKEDEEKINKMKEKEVVITEDIIEEFLNRVEQERQSGK